MSEPSETDQVLALLNAIHEKLGLILGEAAKAGALAEEQRRRLEATCPVCGTYDAGYFTRANTPVMRCAPCGKKAKADREALEARWASRNAGWGGGRGW